jgi:hypothetical protein
MEELLGHPAVQGGVAPFIVGLLVVLLLQWMRLGGLVVVAAFATAVWFIAGFTFSPLTATRKLILLGFCAPAVGMLVDFAFKPNRAGMALLAVGAGAAAMWVFWPVLAHREGWQLAEFGGAATLATIVMVGCGQMLLAGDGLRAGAAGLGAGLGVGVASIMAASATYGLYGISVAAGSGAFLLVQMVRGKPIAAGATFTLPAMLLCALIGSGAMILAQLPWYSLAVIALVPFGARLPVPGRAPAWGRAVLLSLYTFVIAGIACFLAWHSTGGTPK